MSQDVYCPKCGEPWEVFSLAEVAEDSGRSFTDVRRDFTRRGCQALAGSYFGDVKCSAQVNGGRADVSSALFDLLGDDVDGVAAMLDDLDGLLW